ncbi:MAG: gamma-glutamylcyclotransferase [Polyangiales bacterium]
MLLQERLGGFGHGQKLPALARLVAQALLALAVDRVGRFDHAREDRPVSKRLPAEDVRTLDGFEGSNYVRRRVEVRDLDGGVHEADAYTSPQWARGHRPSRRYRDLLVRGARMHGLPDDHVAWLLAHPTWYVPLISEASIGLVDRIARALR